MAEYIERKGVMKEFEQCNAKNPQWTPQRVKTLLLRIPTADVAPVVHGQWVEADEEIYECSECHTDWVFSEASPEEMNLMYCPSCGAKMDGGGADG